MPTMERRRRRTPGCRPTSFQPCPRTPAFEAGGDGFLIVDFDEAEDGDTSLAEVMSPGIVGTGSEGWLPQQSATVYQHQSMLRTMMELLGLYSPPAAARRRR